MSTVAQREGVGQEEKDERKVEKYLRGIEAQGFWEELARQVRDGVRIALEKAISHEFNSFLGALEYERTPSRKDVRNGHRLRDFETVYGVLDNIKVPRARKSSFTSRVIPRFYRRQGRIAHLITRIFLLGLSTRDIKSVSKHIYGKTYSPGLVSRFNKELMISPYPLAGEVY